MSQIIYVVIRHTGEYEDYRATPVHGWTQKSDAESQIETLKKEQEVHNITVQKWRVFHTEWQEKNPAPVTPTHELKPKKRWPSGLRREQITDEMRKERQDIEDFNQRIYEAHHKVYEVWADEQHAAELVFLKEIEATPRFMERYNEGWYPSERDSTYSILELRIN